MTKAIEDFFLFGAIYTALLPILLVVLSIQRTKKEIILSLVCAYSVVEFSINISSLFADYKLVVFLYSIFTVLELWFFALIIYEAIYNKAAKIYIILSSVAFTVFAIIYYLFIKTKGLDSIPIGVETILILSAAFFFLFEQMSEVTQELIYTKFTFWIVAGILLYLSGSFFIYILSNQVDEEIKNAYWMFTNIFTILKNIAFSIGIILFLKRSASSININPTLN